MKELKKSPLAWTDEAGVELLSLGKPAEVVPDKYGCFDIPLYIEELAQPVIPEQPELPQGFTYESGILTANFGNGDILISDTHWPESGHAGISFAPVPQPKRPNLSDYTDLLGDSKTEDIGTLFIVKSNSAESLIAIRNKLDIAISALSPAPAQPVSEPYKLPELNDELIEILGRPNFTCTKLAECLRNCGQHIKRKSEHEQAAVLHVLLNLYIKHGNDWRKHAEEAFTPAVAQESE